MPTVKLGNKVRPQLTNTRKMDILAWMISQGDQFRKRRFCRLAAQKPNSDRHRRSSAPHVIYYLSCLCLMKPLYSDIEWAFEFVSSAPQYTNSARLALATGKVYCFDESGGDSFDDPPDDIHDGDGYIDIPHKWDLDLGKVLIHQFVEMQGPDIADEVRQIFRKKGAYARYRDLLIRHDLLDAWYEYENAMTKTALTQWCADNGIELAAETPADPT